MRAHIIQIGNSRGVRLPKTLLHECGLDDTTEVDISVKNKQLVIVPIVSARATWETAFKKMVLAGDDKLLEDHIENEWDKEDWEWK